MTVRMNGLAGETISDAAKRAINVFNDKTMFVFQDHASQACVYG